VIRRGNGLESKPVRNSAVATARALLLALGVVWLVVANFRSGAWSRKIVSDALAPRGRSMDARAQVDGLFRDRMPTGNVWAEFVGFDPERDEDDLFMAGVYFRGNYVIYPRRVYVAHPSTVINESKAMVSPGGPPGLRFLEELGVHWIVKFARDKRGKFSIETRRLQ